MPPTRADDSSLEAVKFSILTNALLLLVFLGALELFLRREGTRQLLAPKLPPRERIGFLCSRFPGFLSGGFTAWARRVWQQRHQPLDLDPDATILIRFCQLGLKFSLLGTALSCVLLPMYATGPGQASGFNAMSLSNLKLGGSTRFWCVILAAYMLTLTFGYLILREWHAFVSIKRQHFVKAVSGACGPAIAQSRRTLMVEDVPSASWSEQGVTAFFEKLYGPACVYSCVCLGHDEPDLHPSARAAAHLIQVNTGPATAFVTLRSAERCAEAQQVVLSHTSGWQVREAPEPRDLIWSNVLKPRGMTELHQKIGLAATVVCVLFWSVPVTLIQAWANVESLSKWFPAVSDLKAWSPALYALMTSYLPVLALMGLQALLPYFFAAMARSYEGHKTKSGVERVVLNRCFNYQLASLYVTVLSGSLWDSLTKILDQPSQVLDILARSLPKANVYFLSFVLARACVGVPLLLLRPDVCFGFCGLSGSGAKIHCAFGYEASSIAIVLVIGITYSFIAPAILPACAVYFAAATLSYRWLFTHVYDSEFDGSGVFWYDLFNCVILGLLLSTLSLIGLAILYGSYTQLVFLIPLPVLVVYLALRCWGRIGWKSRWTALEDAVRADQDEGSALAGFQEDLYAQPCEPSSEPS